MRHALPVLAALLAAPLAVPALAQPQPAPIWGGSYSDGVFSAGGGDATNGHLSLQCTSDRLADAGTFHLQFDPAASIPAFADAPPELDFVIDGRIVTLPVIAENGARFFYRSGPADDALTLALVSALRRGLHLVVAAPELDIARIPLAGSAAALSEVARCVTEDG